LANHEATLKQGRRGVVVRGINGPFPLGTVL